MTMQTMLRYYNKKSAAHKYIVGFPHDGNVYYVTLNWNELVKLLKEDHASSARGGAMKARVYVSSEAKKAFLASGRAAKVCELATLENSELNRGHAFEKIITELLTDTVWVKDNVPFYVQGDINVNGEEIQIKYTAAELTNEKTIERTMKLLGK